MEKTENVFRHGNVIVRIHGKEPSREVLEKACIKFMLAVEAAKAEAESKKAAGDEGAA